MKLGQTVVYMGTGKVRANGTLYPIPDLEKGGVYKITGVSEKPCGCGGIRIELEGVSGNHCTKGFILGADFVDIYRRVKNKLEVVDFELAHAI